MAIAGLLVHTLPDDIKDVEKAVGLMDNMTTYGIHEDQYVVVVAEVPSDKMENIVGEINGIDGVLTIYTTYLTVEDEIDDDGNLQTDLSLTKLIRKKPKTDII